MAAKAKAKDTRDPLTDRQREVLKFISDFSKQHGYPPAYRDIGDGLGIQSPNGIVCHLKVLIKKGYLAVAEVNGRKVTHSMRVVE